MGTDEKITNALLVAGGEAVSRQLLQSRAAKSGLVVAVDGGLDPLLSAKITPGLFVGDMDSATMSGEISEQTEVIRLPSEKDDSDLMFAAREIIKRGISSATILCALGGRIDHTLANLSVLLFLRHSGVEAKILSDSCSVEILLPGSYEVAPDDYDTFSLLPFGGACGGVYIENAKYPLNNYSMSNEFPIGLSNRFIIGEAGNNTQPATVTLTEGALLLIRVKA